MISLSILGYIGALHVLPFKETFEQPIENQIKELATGEDKLMIEKEIQDQSISLNNNELEDDERKSEDNKLKK